MTRIAVAVVAITLLASAVLAKDPDKRLAAVRYVTVSALDPLSDDAPVAACLAKHLTAPLTAVDRDADATLTVNNAQLPGLTSRRLFGAAGAGCLRAALGAETLWVGCATLSAAERVQLGDVPCAVADALADKLRRAMRKARDAK